MTKMSENFRILNQKIPRCVFILLVLFQINCNFVFGDDTLPTLYEYYTGSGIKTGLSDKQPYFKLNEKNITIYSGALHYFRVPKAYWSDRLRKMRAAGLNAVETYVPWNLHEPQSGIYDFGDGDNDMSDFLHIEEFVETAQKEDLFVIVRPGPYICAEWEFGGLPSWILRNTSTVRSSKDEKYLAYVKRYYEVLMAKLAPLQFTKGGAIIAFQVENEYGNTGEDDKAYLVNIQKLMLANNITELLFTSDPAWTGKKGGIDGVLQTINFGNDPKGNLDKLLSFQKTTPTMVMEFWTGWYDHITDKHQTTSTSDFKGYVETILDYPSSINMYMFVGSTNWGFLNGANALKNGPDNSGLQPDTTSYDYDSPLAENGDYGDKWAVVKEAITSRNKVKTQIPAAPTPSKRTAYPTVKIEKQLLLSEVIDTFKDKISSTDVIPMEQLSINNNSGQSYGYIVYRKTGLDIPANAVLKIQGYVRDVVLVLVNGVLLNTPLNVSSDLNEFGYWRVQNSNISLSEKELKEATLDLVVGNMGRNNYGGLVQFRQFKGLTEDVYLNGISIKDWQIVPLEFKKSWTATLSGWHSIKTTTTPALYKVSFDISGTPQDTYLNMEKWAQGIVIVNNFVLGRHLLLGPQQALYLPATLLVEGTNEIIVLEHFHAPKNIEFSTDPIFGVRYLPDETTTTASPTTAAPTTAAPITTAPTTAAPTSAVPTSTASTTAASTTAAQTTVASTTAVPTTAASTTAAPTTAAPTTAVQTTRAPTTVGSTTPSGLVSSVSYSTTTVLVSLISIAYVFYH